MSNITLEKNEAFGNKLRQLALIYNESYRMLNPQFRANIKNAAKLANDTHESSLELNVKLGDIFEKSHPYAQAAMITLFVALIVTSVGLVLSNIAFTFVVFM